jgi:glycosyltransferase involved in cell wall biosynthesis
MRVLVWHVHGSWMTSFVQGAHDYLVPVLPDRGPDGRGRARTWDWPASVTELRPGELAAAEIDAVVLQRPQELELTERWTGRRPGVDLPAVYVEHNTPAGPAPATEHPLAGRSDLLIAHVTWFNQLMWDCGRAPTTVVEHGVLDPGYRYTGELASLGVVVNEPLRRRRVAGTDLVLDFAERFDVDVYGMGVAPLAAHSRRLAGRLHEDLPQHELHAVLGRHRAYFHPYRWTSLGLSLIEAMTIGLPVLALAVTETPTVVPETAGVVSNDPSVLAAAARRWLAEPQEAEAIGRQARHVALQRFGLDRFQADWDALLKEVLR